MRERLIKLIKEVYTPFEDGYGLYVRVEHQLPEHAFEAIADHLIAEGVIVPPCKHLTREECADTTCAHCEAEALYKAGYRRQEDVAREIIAEIESIHEEGVGMIVWMENFFKKIAKLKQKYGVQDDK